MTAVTDPGAEDGPMRFDVTALGELVVDLVPVDRANGERLFAAKPGGAPGNVAAAVARLGRSAAMISKVGPGSLGDLLIETLARAGVDTTGVARSASAPTAIAIVSVDGDGERDFVLYRDGCADANLSADEIPLAIVRASRVLHVGSLSLATPRSAAAQRRAVACAREAGITVSVDVNLRLALWRDREAMRATGREAVAGANLVKVSAQEAFLLTGRSDIAAAAEDLWHDGLKLLAVTKGAHGAELFTARHHVNIEGFTVPVLDTVGCGDAFTAALLTGLLAADFSFAEREALVHAGRYACAAGAAMAGVVGAMADMPRRADILALLATDAAAVTGRAQPALHGGEVP